MKRSRDRSELILSASDLVNFSECTHHIQLDLRALSGEIARPAVDPQAALLQRKGIEFEDRYLKELQGTHADLANLSGLTRDQDKAVAATIDAMRAGASVIYQAALRGNRLGGYADFLFKVDRPSTLGNHSYEVLDTKLSRHTKARFLLQLCFYSDLVASIQGTDPEFMQVRLGSTEHQRYRCSDYSHYYRNMRDRLIANAVPNPTTYPNPCGLCSTCAWSPICEEKRRSDDHLWQVANIRQSQILKLQASGIAKLRDLATAPADTMVQGMNPNTFSNLHRQARLQHEGHTHGDTRFELLAHPEGETKGMARLPAPDAGDIYFDMEGNPLHEDGLEYLFGAITTDGGITRFHEWWGHNRAEEKQAFEQFADWVTARIARYPNLHIYHYGGYELSALRRLASLHSTREEQVDNLQRQRRLIDLYQVVRESLCLSEPSYSIKNVEHFYREAREGDVQNAGASILYYDAWCETGDPKLLEDIRSYNEDDCRSLLQLQAWLLSIKPAHIPFRTETAAATKETPDPKADQKARALAEQQALVARLLQDLPADRDTWTAEHHLRELAAYLLDFHQRESKPAWWRMFSRGDMDVSELVDDLEAFGDLQLRERLAKVGKQRSERLIYHYPPQDSKLRKGDRCVRLDGTFAGVTIDDHDPNARTLTLVPGNAPVAISSALSIGAGGPFDNTVHRAAVKRFATSVLDGTSSFVALKRLLRRELPTLKGRPPGSPVVGPDAPLKEIIRAARDLDSSYLFIQGPPGTGKTYTGSHVIDALLRDGKRVGISSNSHKAIHNLLKSVEALAEANPYDFRAVKKASARDPDTQYSGPLVDNVDLNIEALDSRFNLVAGTAWLFADEHADETFDYLFVDEAGQVALGNLVAMGLCARNLVLLGDPMQLGQPIQGVHPGHSGDSTLEYLLHEGATVKSDRGIFLPTSWRMHPDVCKFISDAVYESRLESVPETARQRLVLSATAHSALKPTGIVFQAITHHGCSQKSKEEAQLIVELYQNLLAQHFIDNKGVVHAFTANDILIVAPYNVQVNLLRSLLPTDARVGTVDKFQGQEAPVVIVSMTTSSGEELPRDIEFLFSRNRLNVAISRAKSLAIVIASPALLEVPCTTPEQMALVNTLCWVKTYSDINAPRLHRA